MYLLLICCFLNLHFYNILKLINAIMHQNHTCLSVYWHVMLCLCFFCFVAVVVYKEEEREKGVLLSLLTIEGQGRHATSVIRSESLLGHV